ncbi:N-acetylmuramoyl-L-alanine amidase [Neolewinella aurantiaca]|uniref:N-acetylmuramoyl-L-alanine amidase n=1 Tax=Neolewinella aurantiaca TaxID=2602767 RepID=A0A5C7FMW6_9BACT|nr:N-acetylmuramoyl-L-alanine amidase [Neolewinella aurantiaca]TXF91474.1 N-acetylmuramoyl-L-alanine amidase [Neolewinella aurantiaca]
MKDFLQVITDILAVIFGDAPERPRTPTPLPPALPPASPPQPQADPNEPQDAGEVSDSDDPVVVSHEGEPPRDTNGPEFDPVPAPPPPEEVERPDEPTGPGRPNPPAPEYRARYMWCIDNGHGSLTAGKRSPVLPDGRQLLEFEYNRDISARIFTELDRIGVAYYNVLPEVNVGNFLIERVDRANRLSSSLPKLFVSIHGNAGPAASLQDFTDDEVRGIETWYYHGSTNGRNMAAVFQRKLIEHTGMVNRHLRSKVTGQFYVLRATRMPAVLTESGFYNNRYDLERMLTPEFRQAVADAHVAAILEIEENGL